MGRRHMTEAEKEVERAKAKQRAYLKAQGRGGYVDAAEMQARIRKLHDVHQISFQRIADRTGVDLANIRSHYYGKAITRQNAPLTICFWKTANAVMTTPFGPADVRQQIRACGTQRRLRALIAAGYPQSWIAGHTSRTLAHLNNFLITNRVEVSAAFAMEVEQLYLKYSEMDPVEAGVSPRNAAYARTVGQKRGYEPVICWDEDTIDRPDAVAEWTGACGTPEGYRVHIRETIFEKNPLPLCDPCRAAVETRSPQAAATVIFLRENYREALAAYPKTIKRLAREVFGDEGAVAGRDTLYRWRDGSRRPRSVGIVQRLADALDVPIAFLLDEQAMAEEERKSSFGHGEFNPYVLRVAMEMDGISQHKLSLVPGSIASAGAIGKWLKGEMKPSGRDKLVPIAEYFGVDVEVFYQ